MRHNKKFNHLSRTASHRAAMLSNMACSLIKHKRITTTLAKAKALKKYVEPLITKCKNDTTNSRRVVFSYLQDKYAVTELFKEISVKVADRPGGYTRIIKTGFRASDASEMCFIELVDYDENMAKTKKKATRTRRSKKAAATAEAPAGEAPVAETATEAPAAESIITENLLQSAPRPASGRSRSFLLPAGITKKSGRFFVLWNNVRNFANIIRRTWKTLIPYRWRSWRVMPVQWAMRNVF